MLGKLDEVRKDQKEGVDVEGAAAARTRWCDDVLVEARHEKKNGHTHKHHERMAITDQMTDEPEDHRGGLATERVATTAMANHRDENGVFDVLR